MWSFILAFVGVTALPVPPEGMPAAPFDLNVGQQQIELREPLVARSAGVRLVLFVRDPDIARFEQTHPAGSVVARLISADGRMLELVHTGYEYYSGFSGLLLTERTHAVRGDLFNRLEFDAQVSLRDVRLVWLDRLARRVQDVRPTL
jgi:hypothetical protein